MFQLAGLNEGEEDKIPEAPGIYSFYFVIASRATLGLFGNKPFSDERLKKAKSSLTRRLTRFRDLTAKASMQGDLLETGRAPHLTTRIFLTGVTVLPVEEFGGIEAMGQGEILSFIDSLEATSLLLQPIYIGITHSQTLRDRYQQHKNAYRSGRDGSTFGGRIAIAGIDWGDLVFQCRELHGAGKSNLVQVERFLHSIAKPSLSVR